MSEAMGGLYRHPVIVLGCVPRLRDEGVGRRSKTPRDWRLGSLAREKVYLLVMRASMRKSNSILCITIYLGLSFVQFLEFLKVSRFLRLA